MNTPSLLDLLNAPAAPTGRKPPPATDRGAAPEPAEAAPFAFGTLLVIDGNSLAHRAYHAYTGKMAGFSGAGRESTHRLHGSPAVREAMYGFVALLVAVTDIVKANRLIVGLDSLTNLRKTTWPEYKEGRGEKDQELREFLAQLPRLLDDLGICSHQPHGWEADDVLGTAAAHATAQQWRTVLATSDKDAWQLVNDSVTVLRLGNGVGNATEMTPAAIRRKVGVGPDQYLQFAALRGDSSDNLPGVRGIGPKKAVQLLNIFPTIADAIADPIRLRSVIGPKLGDVLLDDWNAGDERHSSTKRNLNLMRIRTDVCDVDLEAARLDCTPTQVETALRDRRLTGLIARAQIAFAEAPRSEAPPLTDADIPT